ncbi:MAG: helix-hairpin-helix domain-containing protein [Cyclobacteriaceae bacterium]|nr:helix-hairpin-helix domain-containing protein [Cyclobacteriaceae bacterium]
MHRIKALIRAFFGFSRTETNAFLILLPLMIVTLFSGPAFQWWATRHPVDHSADEKSLDSIVQALRWDVPDSVSKQSAVAEIEFSQFDPNVITKEELEQLGLPKFIASRIIRFREKGGVFRKAEDLQKIYGLDSGWFALAKPWIKVAPSFAITSPEKGTSEETKKSTKTLLDINEADSIQLVNVYGIGPALSKRIRTFRDKLGGFVSLEQLREVYGLDTAAQRELKKKFEIKDGFVPKKININAASAELLSTHPYIKRKEANAIVAFRMQHGNFTSLDQLREIKLLTPEWIDKTLPYLTLE